MQDMFQDKELGGEMEQNGFLVLPFLNEQEIVHFKRLFRQSDHPDNTGFYKSYFSPDISYKSNIEQQILEVFRPKLKKIFQNHDLFGGMFVVKPPGEKGHFPIHQDWSFVDEKTNFSINMWCPLEDACHENGNIQVVKGSHKFLETIRGSGTPDVYDHLKDTIDQYLIPLPMKAGEAVFFYHGLLHGSSINCTQKDRVSLGLSIIPKGIPFHFHFYHHETGKVERFLANKDFYLNYVSFRDKRPSHLASLGIIDFPFSRLSVQQLIQKCEEVLTETDRNLIKERRTDIKGPDIDHPSTNAGPSGLSGLRVLWSKIQHFFPS